MIEKSGDDERGDGEHEGSVELKDHPRWTFVVNRGENAFKHETPGNSICQGVVWRMERERVRDKERGERGKV